MELKNLMEWNPWWEDLNQIQKLEGKHRPNYDSLVNSIKIKEVTIITGIRRSGKSTLMYQIISKLLKDGIDPKQVLFINLEDKKFITNSLEDIYQTYRENLNPTKKAYIFLDEIHKKKEWESWIRKKYDQKTNDKFVISGSCSYLLKKDYSTLLTGRNLSFEVFPLSFEEFLSFKKINLPKENLKKGLILAETRILIINLFKEYINEGGFPEIVLKEKEYKMKLLKQYFDDIIFKDVIDRYNSNAKKTEDLALYLITNFTSLTSLRNLRNSLGISYDTIKDYLNYFKEAFLFFTLDHFSYSFKEQKISAPKSYCIDNGLRNAVSFKFSKDEGKLAENLVFIELKRREQEIYYWTGKGEVDFVIKNRDNSLIGINVSYTNEVDERELMSLLEFKKEFKKCKEIILLTQDLEKQEKEIKYIPLWKWLLVKEQET